MTYDDLKAHNGRAYTGMRVGRSHTWNYPNGRWHETKTAPDEWNFEYQAQKQRSPPAPAGSGAPPGTGYHWLILAHQWVRKVDADAYDTLMQGIKFKVAHKRPHWRHWSCEYPDQASERQRVIEHLEQVLERLRAQESNEARCCSSSR